MKNVIRALIQDSASRGKVIEGGWRSFFMAVVEPSRPKATHSDIRDAFYSGAHYLFEAIMHMLEDGAEPTEKDLELLTSIHDELERFNKEIKARLIKKQH